MVVHFNCYRSLIQDNLTYTCQYPSYWNGNRAKYEAILLKVPDVEPEEHDRIPTV